jgi:DNA-binding YbaB/EbfC family protein
MKIPGGGSLQRQLMRQVEKFQEEMKATQEELAALRIEASAGGGVVKAVVSGAGELLELQISPEAVDPKEVEMLQDLVLAAVREALEKARKTQEEKMGALTGGLGLPGLF